MACFAKCLFAIGWLVHFYTCWYASWWAACSLTPEWRIRTLWHAARVSPAAIWCLSNNHFKGKNIQGPGCTFIALDVFPSRFFVCPHSLLALESDRNGKNMFIRYAFHHIYVRDISLFIKAVITTLLYSLFSF